jgi:mannosylglucosylglycerate synthase
MSQARGRTAILHYSAPPVVGGVEAVIQAQARAFVEAGYPIAIVSGRGDSRALPTGVEFLPILEMDSRHPDLASINPALEAGDLPPDFDGLTRRLSEALGPILDDFDSVIVHNIFTKHFNLPLTAALFQLLDQGQIKNCIAWCHDFSWTSPNSRSRVHPGYPWDLLRTHREDVTYVTISAERQKDLAELLERPLQEIRVIYNGVDARLQLGLGPESWRLVERIGFLESDLNLLMPVRVTQAKNIELALQVVSALIKRGVNVRLALTGPPDPHEAGSMEYYQSLLVLRDQLGLEQEMIFIFEAGPAPGEPFTIGPDTVGDLYRLADVMFMPSHREGFGMPVLEAGLAGVLVVSTEIPAAREIASQEALIISPDSAPDLIASQILALAEANPLYRLRRKVRQEYTWQALFHNQLEPLLWRGRSG